MFFMSFFISINWVEVFSLGLRVLLKLDENDKIYSVFIYSFNGP